MPHLYDIDANRFSCCELNTVGLDEAKRQSFVAND
jgi:hypothetical protein